MFLKGGELVFCTKLDQNFTPSMKLESSVRNYTSDTNGRCTTVVIYI